jgi:hypothetical protein
VGGPGAKPNLGSSPGFPVEIVALANFMRLSLLKAAHANPFEASCRNSGSHE